MSAASSRKFAGLLASGLFAVLIGAATLHKIESVDPGHHEQTCAICLLQETIGTAIPAGEVLLPIVQLEVALRRRTSRVFSSVNSPYLSLRGLHP